MVGAETRPPGGICSRGWDSRAPGSLLPEAETPGKSKQWLESGSVARTGRLPGHGRAGVGCGLGGDCALLTRRCADCV